MLNLSRDRKRRWPCTSRSIITSSGLAWGLKSAGNLAHCVVMTLLAHQQEQSGTASGEVIIPDQLMFDNGLLIDYLSIE